MIHILATRTWTSISIYYETWRRQPAALPGHRQASSILEEDWSEEWITIPTAPCSVTSLLAPTGADWRRR
eukprot:2974846-Pyramimonas_sp.AAC.1